MSADACSAEELDDPTYPTTLAGSHERIDQLTEALETREVIAQAKGIIMAKEACDAEEAFAVLRRISQHTHRKLRDVAAEIVISVNHNADGNGVATPRSDPLTD